MNLSKRKTKQNKNETFSPQYRFPGLRDQEAGEKNEESHAGQARLKEEIFRNLHASQEHNRKTISLGKSRTKERFSVQRCSKLQF